MELLLQTGSSRAGLPLPLAPRRPRPPAPASIMSNATAAPASIPLVDLVQSALRNSPYLESQGLRIEAEQGAIRLHGQVGTFFEKQMAQETVRRLDGVQRVENLLEVNWR